MTSAETTEAYFHEITGRAADYVNRKCPRAVACKGELFVWTEDHHPELHRAVLAADDAMGIIFEPGRDKETRKKAINAYYKLLVKMFEEFEAHLAAVAAIEEAVARARAAPAVGRKPAEAAIQETLL